MMDLICKKCKEVREPIYFVRTQQRTKKGIKTYYTTNECKICKGMKPRIVNDRIKSIKENNLTLSSECSSFIERIERQRGYIDFIDSYRLAHYFTETFGYIELFYEDIEEELIFMYKEIKDLR